MSGCGPAWICVCGNVVPGYAYSCWKCNREKPKPMPSVDTGGSSGLGTIVTDDSLDGADAPKEVDGMGNCPV